MACVIAFTGNIVDATIDTLSKVHQWLILLNLQVFCWVCTGEPSFVDPSWILTFNFFLNLVFTFQYFPKASMQACSNHYQSLNAIERETPPNIAKSLGRIRFSQTSHSWRGKFLLYFKVKCRDQASIMWVMILAKSYPSHECWTLIVVDWAK